MPCLLPDGTLSRIGVLILSATGQPSRPEEVSEAAELPLFRARSAIRGLVKAGMLEQRGEFYVMTAEGRKKLSVQKEF
jgi:predicted transcriptional regulator